MFGLTLHESITAILAALTLILFFFAIWKQWIEGPKIELNIGDTIDLVRSDDGKVKKLHLTCSFHNTASRPGAISKILVVLSKGNRNYIFDWFQFYEYKGGHIATPKSKPYPIPILGRSATFEGIEFITRDDSLLIRMGFYKLVVMAYSVARINKLKLILKKEYEFALGKDHVSELSPKNRPGEVFLISVQLVGMGKDLGERIRTLVYGGGSTEH